MQVTSHAMLRYLERVCEIDMRPVLRHMKKLGYAKAELPVYLKEEFGFDIPLLCRTIVPQPVREYVKACDGKATVKHGGHRYVVENNTLLTIAPNGR